MQSSGATHCLENALELDKNLITRPPDEMPAEFEDLGSMTSVRRRANTAKLLASSPGTSRVYPANMIAASRRLTRSVASSDTTASHPPKPSQNTPA